MLSWVEENPEEFRRYAVRDSEIAARYYVAHREKLESYGLPTRRTIGSVLETFAAPLIKKTGYQGLVTK